LDSTIQQYAESFGYGVVRELIGHGIGRNLHEAPDVPNYGVAGRGIRLIPGMTIAVEPMINMGTHKVEFMSDGWTVKTLDRKPSAHYENTIAITDNGVEILSL
jgi:methionyl aminopeptidase